MTSNRLGLRLVNPPSGKATTMRVDEELAILTRLLEAARTDLRSGRKGAATRVAVLEQMIVEHERAVADARAEDAARSGG